MIWMQLNMKDYPTLHLRQQRLYSSSIFHNPFWPDLYHTKTAQSVIPDMLLCKLTHFDNMVTNRKILFHFRKVYILWSLRSFSYWIKTYAVSHFIYPYVHLKTGNSWPQWSFVTLHWPIRTHLFLCVISVYVKSLLVPYNLWF